LAEFKFGSDASAAYYVIINIACTFIRKGYPKYCPLI